MDWAIIVDNGRLREYEIYRINEWSGCIFIGYERVYEYKYEMDKMDDYCGYTFIDNERLNEYGINGIYRYEDYVDTLISCCYIFYE
jgi:hypothetical protein